MRFAFYRDGAWRVRVGDDVYVYDPDTRTTSCDGVDGPVSHHVDVALAAARMGVDPAEEPPETMALHLRRVGMYFDYDAASGTWTATRYTAGAGREVAGALTLRDGGDDPDPCVSIPLVNVCGLLSSAGAEVIAAITGAPYQQAHRRSRDERLRGTLGSYLISLIAGDPTPKE